MMFLGKEFLFCAIIALCLELKSAALLSDKKPSYFDVRDFIHNYGAPASKLNNLAIHRGTGRVYIGAINHLYQLSPNLTLQANVSTGPISNSTLSKNHANNFTIQIDNYNKILVIDYDYSTLIACGNVQESPCVLYSTKNDISPWNGNKVVERANAIGEDLSVVAILIGVKNEDNPNFTLDVVQSCDYPAHTYINLPVYIQVFSKVPHNDTLYGRNVSTIYATAPNNPREETYSVIYVYGFRSKTYSYFLKIQQSFTQQKSPYISKLVQMHHKKNDNVHTTMNELPIECTVKEKHYRLLQAAHVGKPGILLANSLNITPNDDTLFAIFSESEDPQGYSKKPKSHSALCIYSLKAINKNIENKKCYLEGPMHIQNETEFNERCSERASPIMTFDILLTAINARNNGNYTDIFIGTNTGHIKKIIVKNSTMVYEQADITIDEGSTVNSDLLFSSSEDDLYIMTEYRVTKINLQQFNCSIYSTFDHCVNSDDGTQYCGWCGITNKCTIKHDCNYMNYSTWIMFDFRKSASISNNNFDVLGNLTLSIKGLSFINGQLYCIFNVENGTWSTNSLLHGPNEKNIYKIYCPTPHAKNFTSLQPKQHNPFNVTVSISTDYIRNIVTKTFFLSRCNQTDDCKMCVFSTPCHWCIEKDGCEYNETNRSTNITFFNCHAYSLGKKCILSKTPCYWCSRTEKCVYNAEKNAACPNAPISEIFTFWPQRGPHKGGTNITIYGQNLSDPFNNAHLGIRIAGRSCKPQRDRYVAMKKIVCTVLEPLSSLQVQEGPVEVQLSEQTWVRSQQNFTFAKPKIKIIHPVEGPMYGGTVLTIIGENLDIGSSINVFIGKNLCRVFSISTFEIKCITAGNSTSSVSSRYNTNKHPNIEISEVIVTYDHTSITMGGAFALIKDNERDDGGFNLIPKGIPSGGVEILLHHINLTTTQKLLFVVHHGNQTFNSSCKVQNYSTASVSCISPLISNADNKLLNQKNPQKMVFSLTSNESSNLIIDVSTDHMQEFLLYPDPEFYNFLNSSIQIDRKHYIIIRGKNINRACQKTDIIVIVGNDTCEVLSLSLEQVVCVLPTSERYNFADETEEEADLLSKYNNITILIGKHFKRIVPKYNDSKNEEKNATSSTIGPLLAVAIAFTAIFILFITFHCLYHKKILTKSLQKLKKVHQQMNQLELCVAAECKEAFTELQTQITTFTSDNPRNSLPFQDYRKYVLKFLFPSVNDHSIILKGKTILIHKERGLQQFDELITNKSFLLAFIRVLESDKNFSMNDRVYVASVLMITLQKDMNYCTDILKILMSDLIGKNTQCNSHPKLLFRRTESVAEKMLSAWFSFLLHKFLRETAGYPLINLFSAIKQQINKGPVDMITSDARYCLSETKMIRQKIDHHLLAIIVNVSQKIASRIELPSVEHKFQVKVLDCDTISQVKEKIMDVISPSLSYSQRPNLSEICLEWLTDEPDTMIVSDDDHTSKVAHNWRQKNTLGHYGVPDGAKFHLITENEANHRTSHVTNYLSFTHASKVPLLLRMPSKRRAPGSTSVLRDGACLKEWHLVEPFNLTNDLDTENNRVVPEIYLTRLLAMKSSLQKFVNDLFETIFKITHQNNCFPTAIKYMFDFLDDQALQHGITDPEVVHIWKNNCLPLRFWVNLIKNPDFLFDIHKSNPVDSCLSVIAQVLMDSCSTAELHLTKDSAISKLLYAKEIPIYRQWVKKYYADIKKMPKISPQYMRAMLRVQSQTHAGDFDMNVFTYELFKFAEKYKEKLIKVLKTDELAQEDLLESKFERVLETMSASWNS